MGIEDLLKNLIGNQGVQVLLIQVAAQVLHKVFALLDSHPLQNKGKSIVGIVQVLLTLVASLLDAWTKGQAGLVDPSQWTQFIVMVLAVFGLQKQADDNLPKLHRFGEKLKLLK